MGPDAWRTRWRIGAGSFWSAAGVPVAALLRHGRGSSQRHAHVQESGGARHGDGPDTDRERRPDTEQSSAALTAGVRHRERGGPTQRAVGPDTGPDKRESARPRHRECRGPTQERRARTPINTRKAVRKKQRLQRFSPCISAHTVWGLCWYNRFSADCVTCFGVCLDPLVARLRESSSGHFAARAPWTPPRPLDGPASLITRIRGTAIGQTARPAARP